MSRVQEESGFFNGQLQSTGNYDREYDASDFAGYFANFIGDGVFLNPVNQLRVIANTGLTVTVEKGNAFIEGYWYRLKEDIDITLSVNSGTRTTNNIICCELSKQNREITIVKKQNVTSIKPVNNGAVHQLILCNIKMPVGVSSISNMMIDDLRPKKEYCGFVESVVEQVDFDGLFLQLQTQFDEWFNKIKGKLTTDQAGNLQTQIDVLDSTTVKQNNVINSMTVFEQNVDVKKIPNAVVVKKYIDKGTEVLDNIDNSNQRTFVQIATTKEGRKIGLYFTNLINPPLTTGHINVPIFFGEYQKFKILSCLSAEYISVSSGMSYALPYYTSYFTNILISNDRKSLTVKTNDDWSGYRFKGVFLCMEA